MKFLKYQKKYHPYNDKILKKIQNELFSYQIGKIKMFIFDSNDTMNFLLWYWENEREEFVLDLFSTDSDTNSDTDSDTLYYSISIQNYVFLDSNELPEIISNYFMSDPLSWNGGYFASIIWDKIDYVNEDYDPHNYDPEPKFIIYRDDLDISITNKYLFIIDELGKKFYSPTTHYKHFNPKLEKISLNNIKSNKDYTNTIGIINELIDEFTF